MIQDILVTGEGWIGRGVPSVESALRRILKEAEDEIQWTIYGVSAEAQELFVLLEGQLARGVKVVIAINRLAGQPAAIRTRVETLLTAYQHFEVYDFAPADRYAKLHAKLLIVDRKIAIVGSANVSRGGFLRNHELAVLIKGKPAAQLAVVFDRLIAGGTVARRVNPTRRNNP